MAENRSPNRPTNGHAGHGRSLRRLDAGKRFAVECPAVPGVRGFVAGGGERRGDVRLGIGDAQQRHLRESGAVGLQARRRPGVELLVGAGEQLRCGGVAAGQRDESGDLADPPQVLVHVGAFA
jgi:hypothetical protein